ncbi:hypothetical protein F4804DRAFT_341802 [Jackrogersella minutella]|nr:hypothetical protein F4804DRAFT_341802 [Jackrogersella minutella]
MTSSKGPCSLWLPHYWRFVVPAIILTTTFYILATNLWIDEQPQVPTHEDSHNKLDADKGLGNSSPNHDSNNITVNLVVATLSKEDISWTKNLKIPNLNIIRYVSDDMKAEFHPPVPNKGREALIYHTYLHDFYDDLPDITIFTHADETPWHIESILNSSMTFALSHLDLNEVLQRRYFNLRVSWQNACPAWINTTKTEIEGNKQEEPYMHEAFSENFATYQVPEILAGPCCSQFAVTRDAVRRHPKSQYKISMDWLVQTDWDDFISGRVWEHMWPWLFKGEAVDCDVEWKAYCKMYHICFDMESRDRLSNLEEEKKNLEEKTGLFQGLLDLFKGFKTQKRLKDIKALISAEVKDALERGKDEGTRTKLLSDLYSS